MLQTLNLDALKGIKMSQVKSMSDTALKGISKLSRKRMKVAGYSVNPFLLAGAAALALGGYLIYRSRSNRAQLAGAGGLQRQGRSAK